jgi:hypothetical protein
MNELKRLGRCVGTIRDVNAVAMTITTNDSCSIAAAFEEMPALPDPRSVSSACIIAQQFWHLCNRSHADVPE